MTPYGKGRIFRRGGKVWIAYQAPVKGRSREVRESGGRTEAEARKKLDQRLYEVRMHRDGVRPFGGPAADKVRLSALIEDYLADMRTRGLSSVRTAEVHSRPVLAYFGASRAGWLTGKDLRKYADFRKGKGLADATVDRELEIVRSAYSLAKREGIVMFAPPVVTLSKRDANARQGFLEPADFRRLLGAVADPDFADFLEWFWWTAMRPKEIASLRWDAVRGDGILLEAKGAKTGHARVAPLVGPTAAILERRRKARRPGVAYVFHAAGKVCVRDIGGVLDRWYDRWAEALEAAGMPESMLIYDLRRSAVRNMLKAGVSRKTVMELGGWRTEAMFNRYVIVTQADMAEAIGANAAAQRLGQNADKTNEKGRRN